MTAFNQEMDILSNNANQFSEGGPENVKPVDLVHLAKYTMGDSALEAEILTLFSKQSLVYLGQIEKAQTAREWHAAAHTLKGSARAIGAWPIADLAAEAEKIDPLNASHERADIVARLKAELKELVEYIDKLLGK